MSVFCYRETGLLHTVSFQARIPLQEFVCEGMDSEFLCKEFMFFTVLKYVCVAFFFQQRQNVSSHTLSA